MACKQCGECCQVVVFDAPRPQDDIWRYWRLHNLSIRDNQHDSTRTQIGFQNVCHWYDPLKQVCTHYDERPEICRGYECSKCKA